MSRKSKVVMKASGYVVDERLAEEGEVLTVENETAEKLIAAGRASAADVRIRLLRAGMAPDNTWREAGAEILVATPVAVGMYQRGFAEILDYRELGGERLPAVDPPIRPLPRPVDPYLGEGLINIKVTRGFLAGSTFLEPGSATVEVPETVAMIAVDAGAARFVALNLLSWKIQRRVQEWINAGREVLAT